MVLLLPPRHAGSLGADAPLRDIATVMMKYYLAHRSLDNASVVPSESQPPRADSADAVNIADAVDDADAAASAVAAPVWVIVEGNTALRQLVRRHGIQSDVSARTIWVYLPCRAHREARGAGKREIFDLPGPVHVPGLQMLLYSSYLASKTTFSLNE